MKLIRARITEQPAAVSNDTKLLGSVRRGVRRASPNRQQPSSELAARHTSTLLSPKGKAAMAVSAD